MKKEYDRGAWRKAVKELKLEPLLWGCIVAAGLMISCSNSHAVETDKAAHAAGSAAISLAAAPLLADSEHPILYPFAVSFSVGVLKEIYDSRPGGTGFSNEDLAADALGAAVGAVTGNTVYMFAIDHGIGFGMKGKFITSKEDGEAK